jgi:hypothetical protein
MCFERSLSQIIFLVKRASLNSQKMRFYSLPAYLRIIEVSFHFPFLIEVGLKFPLNVIM